MSKPLIQMKSRGLSDDTTYVHCNMTATTSQADRRPGGIYLHLAGTEMQMGHGPPTAPGCRRRHPSISTDVEHQPADMFTPCGLLAGTRLMVHMKALAEKRMVELPPLSSRDTLESRPCRGEGRRPDYKTGSLIAGRRPISSSSTPTRSA
jgi:hypothetical protein